MPGSPEYQRQWAKEHREHLREYHRRWRQANPNKVRQKARKDHLVHRDDRLQYMRERKQEHRARLDAYKREHGCVDCGVVTGLLEFDHRPGEEKRFNIAHGVGYSWDALMAEVAKCDVRCGTCHRKRHAPSRA